MPLKRSALVVPVVAALAAAAPARADEKADKLACVNASEHAQHLRTDGKLGEAHDELIACSREGCPLVVRKDCKEWLAEVDAARPSVVVSARTAGGRDLTDVRVIVDGKLLTQHLDGKALFVDPGKRSFRFEVEGAPAVESSPLVREGEKSRVLAVTFRTGDESGGSPAAADTTAEAEPSARGIPTISYVLGAVGIVATGSFLYFGISGRSRFSDLRSTCAPDCNPSDVDPIRTKLLVADLSLGVAVVSFGLAVAFALTHPGSSAAKSKPIASAFSF